MCSRPIRLFIRMALVAGIRRTHAQGQIRPGNPEAVIMPLVHTHEGGGRHVAFHAAGTFRARRVKMVRLARIPVCGMTLVARLFTRYFKISRMRVMAIRTGNTGLIHFTLPKRTPHIDFVLHLTIRIIQPGSQQRRVIGIHEGLTGDEVIG